LGKIAGLGLQPVADNVLQAPWLFCVTIEESAFGMSRDELMQVLAVKNIETRPFFIPIHLLPPYRNDDCSGKWTLPHTEHLAATGMNLPTFPALTDEHVSRICLALESAHRQTK
jgi:perosamine synthetase